MVTSRDQDRGRAGANAAGQQTELSRIARKRIKKKQGILKAAGEVLGEKGYEGTSLEDIAERLDLTKASLYHYFDSKEALLTACLNDVAEEASARLEAVLRDNAGAPASDRLNALVREHLLLILRDHPHLTELFTHRLNWPRPYVEQIKKTRGRYDRYFRDAINDGVRSGEFTAPDVELALHCFYGAINAVPVWFRKTGEKQIGDLAERLTAVLFRMLGPLAAVPKERLSRASV